MEEDNKLIAEFMGLIKEPRYLSFKTGAFCKNDNDGCYPDPIHVFIKDGVAKHDLRYHDCWNWMIPVVRNIHEVEQAYLYEIPEIINDLDLSIKRLELDNTYKAVVEFIKWYNENK